MDQTMRHLDPLDHLSLPNSSIILIDISRNMLVSPRWGTHLEHGCFKRRLFYTKVMKGIQDDDGGFR